MFFKRSVRNYSKYSWISIKKHLTIIILTGVHYLYPDLLILNDPYLFKAPLP